MYNMYVWRVPLIIVIQRSSTNPGSAWFPEVSQTQSNSTEFMGHTARNSNFPLLSALFHFTADKQRVGLVAFCYSGAVFPKDRKGRMANTRS